MSTSVDEWIENLRLDMKAAQLVKRKYSDAQIVREGRRLFFVANGAQPNRLFDVDHANGSQVIAYEEVRDVDAVASVQRPMQRALQVFMVLERLREKHPDAYADLVRWVAGDIR